MYSTNQVTCDLRAESLDTNTQGMGDFMAVQDGTILSLLGMSPKGRDIFADNEFSNRRVDQLQDKNYSTKIKKNYSTKALASLSLYDKPVQFQLDSGASCNVLRQEDLPASAHVKDTKCS